MEKNKITAITKEKTDVLKEAYKDTLELLDAYDHRTLTHPEGTYYDGNETVEEVAVNMLYDMIKNPIWYDCNKQMAAIKFLLFLEWNNALFVDEETGVLELEDIVMKCSKVLERYEVSFCYLFGSYAKGKATPMSDVDLLISANVRGLKFYGLVEEIRTELHKKVDVLDINQLKGNIELTEEIFKDGIKIYG